MALVWHLFERKNRNSARLHLVNRTNGRIVLELTPLLDRRRLFTKCSLEFDCWIGYWCFTSNVSTEILVIKLCWAMARTHFARLPNASQLQIFVTDIFERLVVHRVSAVTEKNGCWRKSILERFPYRRWSNGSLQWCFIGLWSTWPCIRFRCIFGNMPVASYISERRLDLLRFFHKLLELKMSLQFLLDCHEQSLEISKPWAKSLVFRLNDDHTVSTLCRKSWPTFWLSSSSTMLCKHTDISIACSLHIVTHCSVFFAMRYSNDSSIVGFRALVLLVLLQPPSADEFDVVSSF